MKTNTTYNIDALDGARTIPDKSIDCIVTSPPYYGLRDYGVAGQIGLEESPEQYIKKLVLLFRELRRALKPDGTLWVNIGDRYAGSGKGAAQYPANATKYKQGTNHGMVGQSAVTKVGYGDCKSKDLIGIPWMLASSQAARRAASCATHFTDQVPPVSSRTNWSETSSASNSIPTTSKSSKKDVEMNSACSDEKNKHK